MARARALKIQLAEPASVEGADCAQPVARLETRKANMRHTATLEAMHTRGQSSAYNGYALRNTVESIAESGMTAEQMVVELQRALAEFEAHKTTISACFKATGAKVDAMTFADNS
jgi:phage-related baseplate assembly protein